MKKFSKLMAVLLSLVLCIGMVAPAFAMDGYFYLTSEDGDSWMFLGQGEVKEDATVTDGTSMSNEEMKAAVNAPEHDEGEEHQQTLEGEFRGSWNSANGTYNPGDPGEVQVDTTTIDAFFNGTEYDGHAYDNGTSGDVLTSEKTYTVTWTVSKKPGNGADAQLDENGNVTYNGDNTTKFDFAPDQDTVHFDGTVVKSENTAVKVVVDNFNEEAVENGGLYVRGGISDTESAAVTDAIGRIVAGLENNKLNDDYYTIGETELKDGQFVKTYSEKTYEVTYNASDLLNFAGVGATTFGKVNGHTVRGGLDSVYVPGRGTYTFGGWNVAEVDGNLVYTAVVNYVPEYVDFGTTIDEPAVPLAAGPVTRAEFIDYLWRHEGEPDSDGVCTFTDVPEDHDYVLALAWAEQNGIIEAYEDGTFEPDELVTVAAVREFLGNFADVFGTNAVAAADLTTLVGEDDEAVLNCDEVLAEFFGEEYVTAEDEAA